MKGGLSAGWLAQEPRRVGWELEALHVVLDSALAALVRIAVILVRGGRASELQDDVVLSLLVEFRRVAADRRHDRVKVLVARRNDLALKLAVAAHAARRGEQHIAGLDRARLVCIAALDEVIDDDAAVATLGECNAQRLVKRDLVAVIRQLDDLCGADVELADCNTLASARHHHQCNELRAAGTTASHGFLRIARH